MEFTLHPIGAAHCGEEGFYLQLLPEYTGALTGLEGFSHVQVLWWFDGCDNDDCRRLLTEEKPYTHGPDTVGVFATRSPRRPNPIAISAAQVTYIDADSGVVGLAWIDAEDGTPLLDIKPYTPSVDRIECPETPDWCAHWPKSVEQSGDFDWEAEFNF